MKGTCGQGKLIYNINELHGMAMAMRRVWRIDEDTIQATVLLLLEKGIKETTIFDFNRRARGVAAKQRRDDSRIGIVVGSGRHSGTARFHGVMDTERVVPFDEDGPASCLVITSRHYYVREVEEEYIASTKGEDQAQRACRQLLDDLSTWWHERQRRKGTSVIEALEVAIEEMDSMTGRGSNNSIGSALARALGYDKPRYTQRKLKAWRDRARTDVELAKLLEVALR